jgi:hypothetical protein
MDFRSGSTILAFGRHVTIFSSHVCLGLPSLLFPTGFPTKSLHAFLFSPMRVTHPAHLIIIDLTIIIISGEKFKL